MWTSTCSKHLHHKRKDASIVKAVLSVPAPSPKLQQFYRTEFRRFQTASRYHHCGNSGDLKKDDLAHKPQLSPLKAVCPGDTEGFNLDGGIRLETMRLG
jgi:hypothetical protein